MGGSLCCNTAASGMTFIRVRKKKMKYPNKWTTCRQGHRHQSKYEARYCNDLALLIKAREIAYYDTQVRFEIEVHKKHICWYVADFLITAKDGSSEVHETKGHWTKDAKLKRKLFEACYPHIKYIVIKQKGWKRKWHTTKRRKR